MKEEGWRLALDFLGFKVGGEPSTNFHEYSNAVASIRLFVVVFADGLSCRGVWFGGAYWLPIKEIVFEIEGALWKFLNLEALVERRMLEHSL